MVVVEFFDKDAIENVVSSLLCNPDKVIFVGRASNSVRAAIEEYSKISCKYGKSVSFSLHSIKENTLQNIVDVLEKILVDNGEITIDLTGGTELYLVAAGIVYSRYPEHVQLHRFNVYNEKLQDCDADGNVLKSTPKDLTVEDNIAIYGGKIIYDIKSSDKTQKWDFTDEFIDDINTMWSICRKNAKEWNTILNDMMCIIDGEGVEKYRLEKSATSIKRIPRVVEELKKTGLIYNVGFVNGHLTFDCKNEQIMRCFKTAGQILELKTTCVLHQFTENNDGKKYNEVLTGIVIKWDNFGRNKSHVTNEIDVMTMNGLVPIFVSCKNGDVKVEELYKLNTVANRFGGKYAKKVLVTTEKLGVIVHRAEEMGIIIIDNVEKTNFNGKETQQKINSILR